MSEVETQQYDMQRKRLQETRKEFMDGPVEFLQSEAGEIFLTADSIGRALGYKNPQRSMGNLYLKNADELGLHRRFTLRVKGHTTNRVTAYTEQGAYVVAMLAGTKRAKQFRLWLSKVCVDLRRLHSYVSELERELAEKEERLRLYRELTRQQASLSARSLALYGQSKRNYPELHGLPTSQQLMFDDDAGEDLPQIEMAS